MRKILRPISIVIMAVICLCPAFAAPGASAKPTGTSKSMDLMITTKGKTTMGFLSNQPLDIHDVSSITIKNGDLDQLKDSDDGSHMVAYKRFYYFVDSTVPAYTISMQVTPMYCSASPDGTSVKGPDISMTVDHANVEFGVGSGLYKLAGVAGDASTLYKDISVGGSTILMDQTHISHWEAFSIYADIYDQHNKKDLTFNGKIKLIMTVK